MWRAAVQLRAEGVDIRAVTAWSAFGAFDWASVLTRHDGSYEPGLFDIRAHVPRPTALAGMVRTLATDGEYRHAVLEARGWWRSERRLAYPAVTPADRRATALLRANRSWSRRPTSSVPLLVVGANGTLGRAIVEACGHRDLACRAYARGDLDIADECAVARALAAVRPWAVINCAGFVRVDDAEQERTACWRANVCGAVTLAKVCAEHGLPFVTFSSDLVFDGDKAAPYIESDSVRPLCEYGRSKAEAERAVLAVSEHVLVVRTAAFFGHDEHNFVTHALRALAGGRPFVALNDVVVSPTYVPDLVDATLDHVIDGERGVWHLANDGAVTWEEFALHAARATGVSTKHLRGVSLAELALEAQRPRYTALASERGTVLPPLDSALSRFCRTSSWTRHETNASRGAMAGSSSTTQRDRAAALGTIT